MEPGGNSLPSRKPDPSLSPAPPVPEDLTLFCERSDGFQALLDALDREHAPATPTEHFLLGQMAASWWRSRRLDRIETGLLEHQTTQAAGDLFDDDDESDDESDESEIHADNTKTLGLAFHRDCNNGNALPKIFRCHFLAERSFLRCLEQLHGLRARRAAPSSEPTLAPDNAQPGPTPRQPQAPR